MSETQLDAWIDQEDAFVTDSVRRRGVFIQYVMDEPAFAYTVGLFGLNHPELLIFDVPPDLASYLLNTLSERIHDGENLVPGQLVTVDGWGRRIRPEPVPNPGEIVFAANRYYVRPDRFSVPVLQLSYDDRQGRFPGEPEWADAHRQPRPGTFQA